MGPEAQGDRAGLKRQTCLLLLVRFFLGVPPTVAAVVDRLAPTYSLYVCLSSCLCLCVPDQPASQPVRRRYSYSWYYKGMNY